MKSSKYTARIAGIFFLAGLALFSATAVSCKSTDKEDGQIINSGGTVKTGFSMYYKDETSEDSNRIHHWGLATNDTDFEEFPDSMEERFVPKGTRLDAIVGNFPGFHPVGLIFANDDDGIPSTNIYYERNKITLTFKLVGGVNSKGTDESSLSGLYGYPVDVPAQLDIGRNYFASISHWPETFPAEDTTYFANIGSLEDFVKDVPASGDWDRVSVGPTYFVDMGDYYIAAAEVTQTLYQIVMKENPSHFQGKRRVPVEGELQDYRPVENVSWFDAIVFCNKLSVREGLTPVYNIGGITDVSEWGEIPEDSDSQNLAIWNRIQVNSSANGYRLPTEAEWENAEKAGGNIVLSESAWYAETSELRTHEIAKKSPDAIGLYDMHGNVYEWCWDSANEFLSETAGTTNGIQGNYRVKRGGCYYTAEIDVLKRSTNAPFKRTSGYGFRLAKSKSSAK
ncbi:MAG TPA: hypothetical protein DCM57_01575 [Treponema sp.]|nr:hypothetical protein [Treponema sp.]